MESDHELLVRANQMPGTSPSRITHPLPVAAETSSKWLTHIKRHAVVIRDLCSSLCKLLSSLYSRWTTGWWLLEILSLLLAALSLAMIVLILGIYHDKALPQWPSGITMNSLLSMLSQIGQWGLIGSTTRAIGQLKCLWFARPKRPLMDFVALDEASKGP